MRHPVQEEVGPLQVRQRQPGGRQERPGDPRHHQGVRRHEERPVHGEFANAHQERVGEAGAHVEDENRRSVETEAPGAGRRHVWSGNPKSQRRGRQAQEHQAPAHARGPPRRGRDERAEFLEGARAGRGEGSRALGGESAKAEVLRPGPLHLRLASQGALTHQRFGPQQSRNGGPRAREHRRRRESRGRRTFVFARRGRFSQYRGSHHQAPSFHTTAVTRPNKRRKLPEHEPKC